MKVPIIRSGTQSKQEDLPSDVPSNTDSLSHQIQHFFRSLVIVVGQSLIHVLRPEVHALSSWQSQSAAPPPPSTIRGPPIIETWAVNA